MKKKRVIILGAGGFVSSSVEKKIKQQNISCYSFSRKKLDLTKSKSLYFLKKFIKKDDYIFFAAAKAPVKDMQMLIYNLNMLKNVTDGIDFNKVKKFVYLSSDAVYADTKKKITEKSLISPSGYHGLMHCLREIYLKEFYKNKLCIIRPTLIYGANDPHGGYGPNKFIRDIKNGKNITLFGKGEEKRDHIFIGDVSNIIKRLITNNFFGAINIATGKITSFYDLSLKVNQLIENPKKIKFLKRKTPMPHLGYRAFNIKKLKKILNIKNFNSIFKNIEEQFNSY
jgi:nucleoside-diphosphate-sugar epimerase